MEVSRGFGCVPSLSWDRSWVLRVFIEFCNLAARDEGKVP